MKRVFSLCAIVVFVLLTSAVSFAATSWYFPEGSTQDKDFWMVVTNPNSATANIKFTFYTDTSTVQHTDTVSANRRYTLYVNNISGLDEKPISTLVECTNGYRIYAERALYYPKNSPTSWTWGQAARGISGIEGACYEIRSLPATLSQSGTYKLTADLACAQDNDGITIAADDVTIDLNGFTITGAGQTTGTTGDGITNASNTVRNITITNGIIRDFVEHGIDLVDQRSITIRNITSYNNGDFGIRAGYGGNISNCTADSNTGGGIYVNRSMVAKNNSCYGNSQYGLYATEYNTISNNSVYGTTVGTGTANLGGIYLAGDGNNVVANTISVCQVGTGVLDSVNGIVPAGNGNFIKDNTLSNNEAEDMFVTGDRNYIYNNSMCSTAGKIYVSVELTGNGNVYSLNTYDSNLNDGATNYSGNTKTIANLRSDTGAAQ